MKKRTERIEKIPSVAQASIVHNFNPQEYEELLDQQSTRIMTVRFQTAALKCRTILERRDFSKSGN